MTLLHVIGWPAAIVLGFLAGYLARRRGHSPWLAYAFVLAAGLAIVPGSNAFERAPGEQPWYGLLVWAAWAGFGAYHGWRREPRQKQATHTFLDLG